MDKSKTVINLDEVNTKETNLFWKPEDYGFSKVAGDGVNRGSKWLKDKFTLIKLSDTLWVMKKDVGKDGKALLRTKWHMVIDSKELADIYLKKGLRG